MGKQRERHGRPWLAINCATSEVPCYDAHTPFGSLHSPISRDSQESQKVSTRKEEGGGEGQTEYLVATTGCYRIVTESRVLEEF